jgi:hypothetical protein
MILVCKVMIWKGMCKHTMHNTCPDSRFEKFTAHLHPHFSDVFRHPHFSDVFRRPFLWERVFSRSSTSDAMSTNSRSPCSCFSRSSTSDAMSTNSRPPCSCYVSFVACAVTSVTGTHWDFSAHEHTKLWPFLRTYKYVRGYCTFVTIEWKHFVTKVQ